MNVIEIDKIYEEIIVLYDIYMLDNNTLVIMICDIVIS